MECQHIQIKTYTALTHTREENKQFQHVPTMAKQNINKRGKVTRNTHSPSWCDLLRKTTKASPAVMGLRSANDGTTRFSTSTLDFVSWDDDIPN